MKLSLVMPCYNEEGNIKKMHDMIVSTFEKCDYDYEMVFVNDGSSDKTEQVINELLDGSEQKIKLVSFSRNFGKESAMYAGLKNADGEYVAIIDSDCQQNPDIVRNMVEMLDSNSSVDCVTAYQQERNESKTLRFFKKSFYRIINKISDTNFKADASDFRTMRRNMVDAVLEMSEYHRFSKGIFSWVGFNNVFIPYVADQRASGNTKWSFFKLFKYAMDGIIAFTTAPLKISTFIGILSAFAAIFYMIWVIIQKLVFGIAVPGYATLVVLILLLGGLQLFALGIIGEYLSRTYIQSKRRPIYIAKEIKNNYKNSV